MKPVSEKEISGSGCFTRQSLEKNFHHRTVFFTGVLGVVVDIEYIPNRPVGEVRMDILIKLSCGDTLYAGPEDLVIVSESR